METINHKNLRGFHSNSLTITHNKMFILLLLILFVGKVYAQLDKQLLNMSSNKGFLDIYSSEKIYLDSLKLVSDSSLFFSGGGEYKTFRRFKDFWEPRLFPDKKFQTYLLAEEAYYQKTESNYSNASSESWRELGPLNSNNGIGPAEFISFFDNGTPASTQYMLAGSLPGGLFYSKDFGESWLPTGSDTEWQGSSGCSWAVFHPTNHQIWAASTSGNSTVGQSSWIGRTGGVYLTIDEGVNWEKKADFSDFGDWTIIRKMIYDPSNADRLFVATSFGLFKTDNLSNINPTWTKILAYDIYDLEMKPNNNNVIYVTCSETVNNTTTWKVKKSVNQGAAWTDLYTELNITLTIEVSKAKPDYLYLCKFLGTSYTILFNNNNTWTTVAIGSQNAGFGGGHAFGVEQVQSGENLIVSHYINLRKLNITNTITSYPAGVHVDVEDVVYHPYNSNEVWVGTHGGPEKSINGGNTWVAKYNGFGAAMTTKITTSFSDPSYIILGLYHDGIQITKTVYKPNWNPVWQWLPNFNVDGNQPIIDNNNPTNMWGSGQAGYWRYSANFFNSSTLISPTYSTYWYSVGAINKVNSNYLYRNKLFQGAKEEVYRTTSKGATTGSYISTFQNLLGPSIDMILMIGMVSPYYSNDRLIVWLDARNTSNNTSAFHVFSTQNATAASPIWVELSIPRQGGWINDIEFDPNNPDIVYLCYKNSSDESLWPLAKEMIYKIDYTNPTLPVFMDITKNLPYTFTGSYNIETERGSDGVLYFATDFGVFTTNNQLLGGNDSWQTVGKGLPQCHANGIEINYMRNLLRVGTEGRGAWEISLPCIYNASKININQNTTWNTVERLDRGVVVKSGYTLTINQNARISFPAGDGIAVEPGAKLIIDGATLTSACDAQWQGIEVWGNTTQHQYYVNGVCAQGTVELKNGAVIENAYNGITNWKPDDWNKIGGIIIANGAIFRNNRRSVEFISYKNFDPYSGYETDNLSYFSNCTFEVNDLYLAGASPFAHLVTLWHVKGVKFNGCDFLNNRTNNFTGQAIGSIDAGYKVLALSGTPVDKSFFKNFAYGISASNSETVNSIYVDNAIFSNNGYGIQLQYINGAVIVKSLFEIGTALNCPNLGYGISMYSCSGYAIEDNTFTGGTALPGTSYTGIATTSSGPSNNVIYKNNFQNLNTGNIASMQNGSSYPPTGLTWLCNSNNGNKYDFFVNYYNAYGISPYQRSGTSIAAGNTFSTNATLHFGNGGSSPVYYYHTSGLAPLSFYGLELVQTANINTCLSHYGGGSKSLVNLSQSEIDAKELEFANAFSAYNNVKALYESLKDGGSTANTVEDIENSMPSEMWDLRSKLLGDSPHLSQDALRAASLKTDVLPQSVLFEILAANPDEMRDENFLSFLQTKENPLPEYMIDLLRQIAGNKSYKTVLQEKLNMYDNLKSSAASDILRSKLHDTIVDQSAIINWLDNKGDLASHYQIVDAYLQSGNTGAAQAMLKLIPALHQFSTNDSAEYQNLIELKNLQINLSNSVRNLSTPDSAVKVQLMAIAGFGHGIASAQAHGLLEFWYGIPYCNCVRNDDKLKHAAVKPGNQPSIPADLIIKANPNPATTWITFDFVIPDGINSVKLTISDAQGRTVDKLTLSGKQGQKLLDTRSYSPGMYFYKSGKNEKVSGKFIIK